MNRRPPIHRKRTELDEARDFLLDQGAKFSAWRSALDALDPYFRGDSASRFGRFVRRLLRGFRGWLCDCWSDNKEALRLLEAYSRRCQQVPSTSGGLS